MPEAPYPSFEQAIETLRQFAHARSASPNPASRKPLNPLERCELCGAGLAQQHPHLVELRSRQIVCACDACALLFDGMAGAKYKRVSRLAQRLADFHLTDGQWESLLIPISMAFFFHSSIEGRVLALYPSPAGAVESLLPLDAWSDIEQENPALRHLQPDVEALLVNRVGHAQGLTPAEYYIAPVDECYRLVGLIRTNWKGLSGGAEVWTGIGRFFSNLRSKAVVLGGEPNA